MQDDITDGVQYLIDEGIADPDRVCIMGGSYGGYATLAGMVFTPELYACGVNIVGVSNLISLINSIPAYWGPARQIFTLRMGDPDTDEGRTQLERQSPINHVDKIQRPLLVIHGANDPRVKQAEADQIVVAMRERDLDVEYIVAPDEGHGFRGRENRLAMYARSEEFMAMHLGGRYQSEMSDEIAQRLEAITVDVDTVVVEDVADELDAARTRPLPTVDAQQIAEGEFAYTTTLSLPTGDMAVSSTRRIERQLQDTQQVIVIETQSRTPMGEVNDRYLIDGTSLRPIRRTRSQGPTQVDVEFSAREVSGEIQMQGNEIPIDIELDAPVFGADAALELALAGMELRDGLRSNLRIAEVGAQQRVRFYQVEVTGPETIEVPEGEFETFRVALNAIDGEAGDQTHWIKADAPRHTVKVEGKLPAQMGGGDYSTVLGAPLD